MSEYVIELSFSKIVIAISDVGNDKLVMVSGGDKPHIGCAVVAFPRPSLTGDGTVSATSSVINVVGHKDEAICRAIAEKIASKYDCIVTCTGGFHVDNITPEQLQEIRRKLDAFFL
jgi:hypothetical protein